MLEIKNLSKDLGQFKIKDINLFVNKGEYFVLLGNSGAGKSLLLEIIAGLIKADTGMLILDGKEITNEKVQSREIGLVFQDYAIFPHFTVKENILYSIKNKKISKRERLEMLESIANKVNIQSLLDRRPETLSGGELQRTALARTLILNPKCLLLDEPISSVDEQLKQELLALLRSINRNGQTILHVTHDYEEALSLASKIAVMHNGTIVQTGTPDEIFHHPKSELIANMTGIKNFFKGTLKRENDLWKAYINENIAISLLSEYCEGEGYIMIRSEDIILSDALHETSARNNFQGIIIDMFPCRSGIEVLVDVGVGLEDLGLPRSEAFRGGSVKFSAIVTKQSLENLNLFKGKNVWLSFKATAVRFIRS